MPDTTTNCVRTAPESFVSKPSVVCSAHSAHQTQSFPDCFLQVVCIIRPDVRSWRLAPKCHHEAFRCAALCNPHYERAAAACWHILNCFQICRLGFFKYSQMCNIFFQKYFQMCDIFQIAMLFPLCWARGIGGDHLIFVRKCMLAKI